MESGIGNDIYLPTESEVLLVIRQKIKLDTAVVAYIDGIGDIITIKLDGIATDR